MEYQTKCISFYNGQKMPLLGLGTWQATETEIETALDAALDAGFRHFDTAYVYENEATIGKVFKKWFDSGKVKRDDIFIATKLPNFGNRPDDVEKYIKRSLAALRVSYLDLYLVHHPVGLYAREGQMLPRDLHGNLLVDMTTDIVGIWKAMEEQVNCGRTLSIGLSNFNRKQIGRVLENALIRPANVQVELHVYCQQKRLVKFCEGLGITICAYAPFGSPHLPKFLKDIGGDPNMVPKFSPLKDPAILEMARRYDKSPAQILLRHIVQRGIAVIPKSTNPERIKQNYEVFDFELNTEDMDKIKDLDKREHGRLFDVLFGVLSDHPEYPVYDSD